MKTSDLKKWLKANNITHSVFAEKCRVSKRTVDGWFLRDELPEPAGVLIERIMTESLSLTISVKELKEVMKRMEDLKMKTIEEFVSAAVREKLKDPKAKKSP